MPIPSMTLGAVLAHKESLSTSPSLINLPVMTLGQIALVIKRDWAKPYFGAVPYLEALATLNSIQDNYFADTGASVVAYFLANATTWRGEIARAVKAELNKRLKATYR